MAPETRPRALVTGGTGVIGPALAAALVDRGYDVRVLARREPEPGLLPAGTQVVVGDVTDADAVARAVRDCDVVFHLAAMLHIYRPDPGLEAEYRRVNVTGTSLLADAAYAAGAKRFVFFSTIAVYGGTEPPEVFTEDSPTHPASFYAVTKLEAEAMLRSREQQRPGFAVILRLAGVYGPRLKGNYVQVLRALRKGWFLHIGPATNRRTLIHVDDVVAGAILAAEHEAAGGQVFNLTDGAIHTFGEIVDAIAAGADRRPPRASVPLALAGPLAAMADSLLLIARRPPKARALLEKLTEDLAVSGARMQQVLGFTPSRDIRGGWRDTISKLEPDRAR